MPEITLTVEQLRQLKDDMFKTEEMLSDGQINALAVKVNKSVDLPFIGEEKELVVYAKVIKWIDRQLYKFLPNEYYKLIKDTRDGISEKEAQLIQERLTPVINKLVNIPVLTENHEKRLIALVLDIIIHAMIKGFKLEEKTVKE